MATRNVAATAACRNLLLTLALVQGLPAQAAGPSPGTRYRHVDHLGSTVAWSDMAGNVVQRMAFRPYGRPRHASRRGSDADTGRFTGKARDAGTGLYHFGARYHDPLLGRFLAPDAARQTRSPYLYAGAAPLQNVDPHGNTFGPYAREALSFAGYRRGLDFMQVVDPATRAAIAADARRYADLRAAELRTRARQLSERSMSQWKIADLMFRTKWAYEQARDWTGSLYRDLAGKSAGEAMSGKAETIRVLRGKRHWLSRYFESFTNYPLGEHVAEGEAYVKGLVVAQFDTMLEALEAAQDGAGLLRVMREASERFDVRYRQTGRFMQRGDFRGSDLALAHPLASRMLKGAMSRVAGQAAVHTAPSMLLDEATHWGEARNDLISRYARRRGDGFEAF